MKLRKLASGLVVLTRERSKPTPDIGDLDYAVPGPDERFQSHGPGCGCGDLDCPWYKGEVARREYEAQTPEQRAAYEAEAKAAMSGLGSRLGWNEAQR